MSKNNNLIFDVGMHKGEDTAFYLQKGFHVVAFEANPELVTFCKQKFQNEIDEGRLVIVEGAIIDQKTDPFPSESTIKFYVNEKLSVWGTVDENWMKRNSKLGKDSKIIEVPKINFQNALQTYGIPYYLKIDIEGMDRVCLNALLEFDEKPSYLSIESEKVSFKELKNEMNLLLQNGYKQFKIVNQQNIHLQKEPKDSKEGQYIGYTFESGSTGLFGTDLPSNWMNHTRAIQRYKLIFLGYKWLGDYGLISNRKLLKKIVLKLIRLFTKQPVPGWYDTHAKLD